MLTGFLQCGICGANLIIVSGRGKSGNPSYGCPQNFNRGACSNAVKQRADEIEEHLFSMLQKAILQPEAVAFAIKEFERQLRESMTGLDNNIGAVGSKDNKRLSY